MITIENLKQHTERTNLATDLEKHVLNYAIQKCDDDSYSFESYVNDLMNHGCQSGMIGDLIYYNDTVAFYEDFKDEINTMLSYALDNTGYSSPAELFGHSWNEEDPLALNQTNQNLLAWFAFEETTRNLAIELGMDV